jgi:hypothetical protein
VIAVPPAEARWGSQKPSSPQFTPLLALSYRHQAAMWPKVKLAEEISNCHPAPSLLHSTLNHSHNHNNCCSHASFKQKINASRVGGAHRLPHYMAGGSKYNSNFFEVVNLQLTLQQLLAWGFCSPPHVAIVRHNFLCY